MNEQREALFSEDATARLAPFWPAIVGLNLMVVATAVYWLSARLFDAGRPDFFYLADAFLHGRTWLVSPLGPHDVITVGGHTYVPFAPFPGIALRTRSGDGRGRATRLSE